MKTVCDNNQCNGCMACVDICPKNCIAIEDNIFSLNAHKDQQLCIQCGQCEKVCPQMNIVKKNAPKIWKQGWADSDIRAQSSSGGAATAIMLSFIQNGGYVASCLFSKGQFVFDITNSLEEAKKFAGSKYVKSNPVDIYKKIQERLKTHKVLFVGLPCQVAAIKNFIQHDNKLYTIDLICHGTPSSKVLGKFFLDNKIDISSCEDIRFRNNTSFGIEINGRKLCQEGTDDYLLSFIDDIDYTENCYSCQFAELNRVSDITLGDSWGTEYTEEEKKGISLILVQTENGKELLENSNLILKEVDLERAVNNNQQLRFPSKERKERKRFLNMLTNGNSFSYATFIIFKKKIIKRKIKEILRKMH